MDKHVLHNIIHKDASNNSADCPVCNGKIDMEDKKTLMSTANDVLEKKQKLGMMYSEEEKELLEFAELTSKARKSLPTEEFAYIDSKGGKHLPIHDASHVRNALARFNQTDFESEDAKAKAKAKIDAKAKELGVDAADNKNKASEADLFTLLDVMQFSESKGVAPKSFKVLPFGTFKTKYGTITLTKENAQEMIQHYNEGLRAGGNTTGIPIDFEHGDTMYKDMAGGWMKRFGIRDDGMYCEEADWTKPGKQALEDGVYKFISPEFYLKNYTDPETGKSYSNVITGAGLVNKPAFAHSLDKLVNAEVVDEKNLTNNDTAFTIYIEPIKSSEKNMDIHKIVAKEKSTRTSEEAAFLAEHQDELTFAEAKSEGLVPEAKKEDEKGKVTMSEGEVKKLQDNAQKGFEASEKLRKMELREEVKKLVFTEKGLKLPTAEIERAVDLLMTMSEEQAKVYKEQLKSLPAKEVFGEEGSDEDVKSDTQNAGLRFNELVKAKRKEAGNEKMTYDEASKIVAAENPDLTKMMYGQDNE